jgi:DNA-directed RNA polymerase beta' subunit
VGEVGYGNTGEERLKMYDAISALYGFGDPVNPKTAAKGVSGFIRKIVGSSPKFGDFQSKVISKQQDVVGRGTIVVNPDLDMDQVGVPEDMAWTLYRPFAIRRLVRSGVPIAHAIKEVENRSKPAESALKNEMAERPLVYTRAPAWHKYSILSAWGRMVPGDAIHISPIVCKGFNADFDGDAMNIHVPVSEGALKDAREKLLPSRNLISIRDFYTPMYQPAQEMILGMFNASTNPDTKTYKFRNKLEMLAALKAGKIRAQDNVEIAS